VRVGVLGPVEVVDDGREIVPSAAKERSLLAVLALNAMSAVTADGLIDALWGESAPTSARKTLQTYVSNIRRALGPGTVATTPNGYVLRVAPDDVDVIRFRALVRAGEDALRDGVPGVARDRLASAIALWRGEPFGGVAAHTGLAAEAVRLREEHASALEARIAADLAVGEHRELVGELEALLHEHPFRERLWGHLMVALYRSGRQADSLAAFERARVLLREELGLEPGGELRRLERAVLAQDASVVGTAPGAAATAPPLRPPRLRSPVRYAVARDGTHVAFQTFGDGPIDLIAVPGFVSHLDMWWDAPTDALVERLASFSRLILFDKRGMGLSDRPNAIDVEMWLDDIEAVLDAARSERAVVLGISAGAPTAALYAARHPERVRALILYGGYARFLTADDYAFGTDAAVVDSFIDNMQAKWGTGVGISVLATSRADDPVARQFWARLQTTSASPAAAAEFLRALSRVDVRRDLPAIIAPTLVLHATRDTNVPIESARLCNELIPGSRLVELDSDIHLIWLSDVVETITTEIEQFVRRTVVAAPDDTGRVVLATVLAVDSGTMAQPEARTVVCDAVARDGGRVFAEPGLAVFDRPSLAIRCGTRLACALRRPPGVAVHSGECEVTATGVRGLAVDVVTRMAAAAAPGELLVTRTVRDLVAGTVLVCEPRAPLVVDGSPDEWQTYAVRTR
jgi:DNA-binding SARP family transcriptional activator/pimeloyl-ACP methyl ester carboxylesterase